MRSISMTPSAVCAIDVGFPQSRSTGKERDAESGNDYFGARYYSSALGRFMSPDWSAKAEPIPYSKLDDPQSLNLYAYVRNNPILGVDADGHTSSGMEAQYAEGNANTPGYAGESQLDHDFMMERMGVNALAEEESGEPQDPGGGGPINPDPQNRNQNASNFPPKQMKDNALSVIQGNKDCRDWLDSGGLNAYQVLSKTDIVSFDSPYDIKRPILMPPDGETSLSPNAPIEVNAQGRFYGRSFNQDPVGGKYMPGTYGARMTIVFHELAHHLNIPGFRPDGIDVGQSMKNTTLLLQHCVF